MDILKTATDWAKTEVHSTSFFVVMGVLFIFVGVAFWYLGKTDMAKAYVIPASVAGMPLLVIGLGLSFTNKARITKFENAYQSDAAAFVDSEIERAEATLKEYQTIVFKAVPAIIAVCALLIIFMNGPLWRASMITTIAMLVVILLIDGTAHSRIAAYHEQLVDAKKAGIDGS
jgi:hypothetical protein